MSSRLDKKKYQYVLLWERLGIRLKKILLVLFFLTVASQSMIFFNIDVLPKNTTMELEGEAVEESYHYEPRGHIRITADAKEDITLLQVYLNGDLQKSQGNGSLVLDVRNNDIIEASAIESQKYINIRIEEVSDNIIEPKIGTTYRIGNNIVALGRVKLK